MKGAGKVLGAAFHFEWGLKMALICLFAIASNITWLWDDCFFIFI